MRKFFAMVGVFGFGLLAFAEGGSAQIPTADISTITTAVSTFAQSALSAVTPIAVAFVAFFLLRLGVRIVKGIASSAK